MKMNTKQVIAAAIVLAATSSAFAQQLSTGVSTKTRAEVVTELQQAQAAGNAATYGYLGLNNPAAAAGNAAYKQAENVTVNRKTRAEVIAELQQAQANGTIIPASFLGYDTPFRNRSVKQSF
jgi:hypothetical protein